MESRLPTAGRPVNSSWWILPTIYLESRAWWTEKFAKYDPTHVVEISGNIMGDAKNVIKIPKTSFDGSDIVKLNIGSFTTMFHYGWTNTDIRDLSETAENEGYIFRHHDSTKPFPVKDGFVNLIFSSHMLEHLSSAEAVAFLKECYRMLCDGGVIRIAVPDVGVLMKKYTKGELDFLKHISVGAGKAMCQMDMFHEVALVSHVQMFDRVQSEAPPRIRGIRGGGDRRPVSLTIQDYGNGDDC